MGDTELMADIKRFTKEIDQVVGKYVDEMPRADLAASVVSSGLANILGKLAAWIHEVSPADDATFSKEALLAIYTYQVRITLKSFLKLGPRKIEMMTPELLQKILQMDAAYEAGERQVHN